jgi:GxxExxY protein
MSLVYIIKYSVRKSIRALRSVLKKGKTLVKESDISRKVIGCAIEVHRQLGPGLLEAVYEEAFCYELSQAGLSFERQQRVPIKYKNVLLATPLRLDLIVEAKVIIDSKAKSETAPIDLQQLLTYLRLRNVRLGLVINFNVPRLVDGVQRVVNGLPES